MNQMLSEILGCPNICWCNTLLLIYISSGVLSHVNHISGKLGRFNIRKKYFLWYKQNQYNRDAYIFFLFYLMREVWRENTTSQAPRHPVFDFWHRSRTAVCCSDVWKPQFIKMLYWPLSREDLVVLGWISQTLGYISESCSGLFVSVVLFLLVIFTNRKSGRAAMKQERGGRRRWVLSRTK